MARDLVREALRDPVRGRTRSNDDDGHALAIETSIMIPKLHAEFHALDMDAGWEVPAGYPSGIKQKILSGSLDERRGEGSRTRLLKFEPGVYTTAPFVHEYWEEVLLVAGDLTVGNDPQGNGGESFAPFTYACRPPGALHGPFRSDGGCLLLEMHYFDTPAETRG